MARFAAFRQIVSLADPWRGWLSCAIYVFLALAGAIGLVRGERGALAFALVGVYGLGTIVWSWYRVEALRLRRATRVVRDTGPAWVREMPITPAVATFARHRLLALALLVGIGVCAISAAILALTARIPHPARIAVAALSLAALLAPSIGVLAPQIGDARATTSREVAGPLTLALGWRGAAAQCRLRVGEEAIWIPLSAVEHLRNLRGGIVATTRRTRTLLEVRGTDGEVHYRTPGYPGTTVSTPCLG